MHDRNPGHCICGGIGYYLLECTPARAATDTDPARAKCSYHNTAHACFCTYQQLAGNHHDLVRAASGLNLNQQAKLTVERFDPRRSPDAAKVKSAIAAFVSGNAEPWLVLIGPTGTGKSHAAAATILAMVSQNVSARYVTAEDLLEDLREGDATEGDSADRRLRPWVDVPVLAIDDLKIELLTSASQIGRIERLLMKRFDNVAPTIVTSNNRLKQFPDRIASRFSDPTVCQLIIAASKDQRGIPANIDPDTGEILDTTKGAA